MRYIRGIIERGVDAPQKGENTMEFTEIWNEAYNIFTDNERTEGAQYNDMQKYLSEQIKAGNISAVDKCYIAKDVMETAVL